MKKTYFKPAMKQILVKNAIPLAESVSFSIDAATEGDAGQAAARGGSFWDEGND